MSAKQEHEASDNIDAAATEPARLDRVPAVQPDKPVRCSWAGGASLPGQAGVCLQPGLSSQGDRQLPPEAQGLL